MSVQSMRTVFLKFIKPISFIFVFLLIFGVVYSGLGANISGGADPTQAQAEALVAKVGGQGVTRDAIARELEEQLRSQGQPPAPDQLDEMRVAIVERARQREGIIQAAKAIGASIDDAAIDAASEKLWTSQLKPGIAQSLGLSATASDAEVEAAARKQVPNFSVKELKAARIPREAAAALAASEALTTHFKKGIAVDKQLVKDSYQEIQVRHILIKSGEGGLPDAQAKAKAEKLLAELAAAPTKFPGLAMQHSDDPGSKKKGGFYDWTPAGQYVTEFWQGALAAGVGKINPQPIKTSFGYHLIKLEGVRPGKTLPKDFDTNAQTYIDQYIDKLVGGKAQEAVSAATEKVAVEYLDPGLKAARLEREARSLMGPELEAKVNEVLAELDKIPAADDPTGAVPLRKATAYMAVKKYAEAAKAYEDALRGRNLPETRIALANVLMIQKDTAGAEAQLAEAEKLAPPPLEQMYQMADLYKRLGKKDKERAVQEKAQQMLRRQLEQFQKAQAAQGGQAPGESPSTTPPSDAKDAPKKP